MAHINIILILNIDTKIQTNSNSQNKKSNAIETNTNNNACSIISEDHGLCLVSIHPSEITQIRIEIHQINNQQIKMRSQSSQCYADKMGTTTCTTLFHATYKTKAIVKQPKPRPTKASHCLPQTHKNKPLPKFSQTIGLSTSFRKWLYETFIQFRSLIKKYKYSSAAYLAGLIVLQKIATNVSISKERLLAAAVFLIAGKTHQSRVPQFIDFVKWGQYEFSKIDLTMAECDVLKCLEYQVPMLSLMKDVDDVEDQIIKMEEVLSGTAFKHSGLKIGGVMAQIYK